MKTEGMKFWDLRELTSPSALPAFFSISSSFTVWEGIVDNHRLRGWSRWWYLVEEVFDAHVVLRLHCLSKMLMKVISVMILLTIPGSSSGHSSTDPRISRPRMQRLTFSLLSRVKILVMTSMVMKWQQPPAHWQLWCLQSERFSSLPRSSRSPASPSSSWSRPSWSGSWFLWQLSSRLDLLIMIKFTRSVLLDWKSFFEEIG